MFGDAIWRSISLALKGISGETLEKWDLLMALEEYPELERLQTDLNQFNLFEALGEVRAELPHPNFLAALQRLNTQNTAPKPSALAWPVSLSLFHSDHDDKPAAQVTSPCLL
jgi:hypothetical protein